MTVLVTCASQHGATEEITQRIVDVLLASRLEVNLLRVEHVADPQHNQAVVLGSAVYIGKWRKEAVTFLGANEAQLAERPVWLFSSGPPGEEDALQLTNGWRFPEALQPIANRIGPRDIALFHGKVDMQVLSLLEKLMVKVIRAPVGDFREWDAIDSWATAIADALQAEA